MTWACMAARGAGSPMLIDDVTADRSISMNSAVYRVKHTACIRSNDAKQIGQFVTVQMDIDSEYIVTPTQNLLKAATWDNFLRQSLSPDLVLIC